MNHFIERTKFYSERWAPLIVAELVALTYDRYHACIPLNKDIGDLLLGSLDVAAIGTGFLISAKTILLSISGSRIVRKLKVSGHFLAIIKYFISATWWSALATLVSAMLLWLDLEKMEVPYREIAMLCWVLVCSVAITTSIRVVYLFGQLVKKTAGE